MRDGWTRSLEGLLRAPESDDWYDEPPELDLPPDDPRSADLTEIVLLHGEVLDVRRRPVSGSGYECAALELAHLHPTPPPRVERVVVRESPREEMLDWLARVVGGAEVLDRLDTDPLPDPVPIDASGLGGETRDLVLAVDARLVEAAAGWVVRGEVLTACRRLLVAAEAGGVLRLWRDLEPVKIAAAVVYCIARANGLVGQGSAFTIAHWLRDLGTTSAPSSRSASLARALGDSQWAHGQRPTGAPDVYVLGDTGMLVSRFRRELVHYRDLAERLRSA